MDIEHVEICNVIKFKSQNCTNHITMTLFKSQRIKMTNQNIKLLQNLITYIYIYIYHRHPGQGHVQWTNELCQWFKTKKRVRKYKRYPTMKFKEKEPKNLLVHNKLKTDHVGGTK